MKNINTYSEALATLNPRASRQVGDNLQLVKTAARVELQFYGQTIFQWHSNGINRIVKPDHMPGNQLSVTTKRHLNNFMPTEMNVFTQKRIDMVRLNGAAGTMTLQLFR